MKLCEIYFKSNHKKTWLRKLQNKFVTTLFYLILQKEHKRVGEKSNN